MMTVINKKTTFVRKNKLNSTEFFCIRKMINVLYRKYFYQKVGNRIFNYSNNKEHNQIINFLIKKYKFCQNYS